MIAQKRSRLNISGFVKEKWDLLLICLAFLISIIIVFTPRIQTNDDIGYYSMTRSLVIDKDLDLKNEYLHYTNLNITINMKEDAKTKLYYSQYPVGISILELPFTLFGHSVAKVFNYPQDGYSVPYIYFTCLGSALYGLIGLFLVYRLLNIFFKKIISLIALLGIWLATPLYFYMFLQPSVSHSFSFFSVTLFIYVWLYGLKDGKSINFEKVRERSTGNFFLLGCLAGLMTLVRYQDGIFVLVLVAEFIINTISLLKKKDYDEAFILFSKYVISIAGFMITLLPQLLLLIYLHKSANPLGFYDGGSTLFMDTLSNIPKVLFSSYHGVFYWHPLLLLAVLGIILGVILEKKESRILFIIALSVFLCITLTTSSWGKESAFAAQSFGHRFYVSFDLFFGIGIAYLISRIMEKIRKNTGISEDRILLCSGIIIVALILWNFNLMIQYGSRMISRDGPVTFEEMLHNTIYEMPRSIINIAKKFLFNRSSLK